MSIANAASEKAQRVVAWEIVDWIEATYQEPINGLLQVNIKNLYNYLLSQDIKREGEG